VETVNQIQSDTFYKEIKYSDESIGVRMAYITHDPKSMKKAMKVGSISISQ
jgi:hypothetical protein